MTSDIEMLPLPEWTGRYKVPTEPMSGEGEMLDDLLHRYGHAVAEHNVAARDAEIKWLRMDVKEWKVSHAVLTDTCHHLRARADRLEEALREYRYAPKFSHDHDAIKRTVELEDEIDELLREQEDGRD